MAQVLVLFTPKHGCTVAISVKLNVLNAVCTAGVQENPSLFQHFIGRLVTHGELEIAGCQANQVWLGDVQLV